MWYFCFIIKFLLAVILDIILFCWLNLLLIRFVNKLTARYKSYKETRIFGIQVTEPFVRFCNFVYYAFCYFYSIGFWTAVLSPLVKLIIYFYIGPLDTYDLLQRELFLDWFQYINRILLVFLMIAHPVILFYWVKKKTNYQLEFPKSLKQILLLIYQDLEVIFFELCQFKFNFLISSIFIIIAGLFGIFLAIVLANIALTPFVWYIASVISM